MNDTLRQTGLTLIEMVIVILAASILLLGLTGMLAHNQRAFNRTQHQLFGDIVTDGYAAQRAFDHLVRRSTQKYCQVNDNGLEVYYYSDPNAGPVDRYGRFNWSGTEGADLTLTTGNLSTPGDYGSQVAGVQKVMARNVTNCRFVKFGASLRMYLTLNDGTYDVSICASANRHN